MALKNEKSGIDVEFSSENTGNNYRQELLRGLTDVQTRNNALNSMEIINSNKIKEMKSKLMKHLLDEMAAVGVDLGNIDSINSFLNELERTDPDLKTLFAEAFDSLSGEEREEEADKNMEQTS